MRIDHVMINQCDKSGDCTKFFIAGWHKHVVRALIKALSSRCRRKHLNTARIGAEITTQRKLNSNQHQREYTFWQVYNVETACNTLQFVCAHLVDDKSQYDSLASINEA